MNVRQLAGRIDSGPNIQARGTPAARSQDVPPRADDRFAEYLRRARDSGMTLPQELKVSAHARERMMQRGIAFGESDQRTIQEAMTRLEDKGAQNALLLRSDAAFVVNVPNRTIVTAIDRQEMQERVFTQIDSAALL